MDFKVTGTRDGITALQMDIKVQGINEAIIRAGLKQALDARLTILDKMTEVMPEARGQMSDFAPRITTIKINPEKIREIIGKGGSMIRKIQEETQTEINVEDDGSVEIAAVSGENARKAIQWIESLTRDVEVGALYLGKVTRIMGFGAFVEILPGKEGLVRIGELADYHVPTVEDVVSVGDEVMVVVIEVDRQGRINLSRKAINWIESLTREVEIGALYLGKVTRLMGFGCFVEILPGKEGLIRIGELADYHVPSVEDVVSVGDEVMVVVTEIDRQGRVNLSRKAAMQRHLAKTPA